MTNLTTIPDVGEVIMQNNKDRVPLYQLLAQKFQEYAVHKDSDNEVQETLNVNNDIEELVYQYMPAGNGVDYGTRIDLDFSDETLLIFNAQFHHYDNDGNPGDWTSHTITVSPARSLVKDIEVSVTGEDRDEVIFYLYNLFYDALMTKVAV
jgi:hypothetical protein